MFQKSMQTYVLFVEEHETPVTVQSAQFPEISDYFLYTFTFWQLIRFHVTFTNYLHHSDIKSTHGNVV